MGFLVDCHTKLDGKLMKLHTSIMIPILMVMCITGCDQANHAVQSHSTQVSNDVLVVQSTDDITQRVEPADMSGVRDEIRTLLKERLAGVYIDWQPSYQLVVRVVGNEPLPKRDETLTKHHPVRFELGAAHTIDELIASYDNPDNFAQLKALLPTMQGIGVDERTGEIVIDIMPADDHDAIKKQVQKLLNKPIRFEVQAVSTTNAQDTQ